MVAKPLLTWLIRRRVSPQEHRLHGSYRLCNTEIGGVYGNATLIDNEGKADGRSYVKQEIRQELVPDFYAYLFLKDPIPTSNLILRRAMLEQAGRYDPALPSTED